LVTRKAFQNHIKVGLKTGLGSFVFHIYVFMGVIELITGERIFHLLDHLLILAVFITGGLAGAFLCKRFSTEKKETHDLRQGQNDFSMKTTSLSVIGSLMYPVTLNPLTEYSPMALKLSANSLCKIRFTWGELFLSSFSN